MEIRKDQLVIINKETQFLATVVSLSTQPGQTSVLCRLWDDIGGTHRVLEAEFSEIEVVHGPQNSQAKPVHVRASHDSRVAA